MATFIGYFNMLKSTKKPTSFVCIIGLTLSVISGCANVPLDRTALEKLPSVHVVRVITPSLEAPTFIQAVVNSPISAPGAGIVPALIAQDQTKTTFSPPMISDVGALVTEKLELRLREQSSQWPPITSHANAVPYNYVYPDGAWLRVEVTKCEIAVGFERLLIGAKVSLWNAQNKGEPLWVKNKLFSGLVHGGEKIVMENLPSDPSQLNREIERAADWLAKEISADIR